MTTSDPEVLEAAHRPYTLTLLLDVDVPWVADPVRYLPEDRGGFYGRCRAALERHERAYVALSGDWEARWRGAVTAVEGLLKD